jgi:glucose/arabinose dehydrogenase
MTAFKFLSFLILIPALAYQASMTQPVPPQTTPTISTPGGTVSIQESTTAENKTSPVSQAIVWPTITLNQVITGLSQPLHIANAGDGSGRLFIVEKTGRIKVYKGSTYQGVFLDIHTKVSTTSEQGLLSVVFPPAYGSKGHFYVDYTNVAGDTVIARYRVSSDPNLADSASEEILLTIDQPYANHNGGQLAFGPDGYLYIGMGDGGSGGDPGNRAQNPAELLGKILRIDVEQASTPIPPTGGNQIFFPAVFRSGAIPPYRIPPGNPFINTPGYRPEIWTLGLRNPWRFSFDRTTGNLFIADVGQDAWEEVNFQPAGDPGGRNYGWRILEGAHCYNPSSGCVPPPGYVAPAFEYPHGTNDSTGCAVTGGFVYRGNTYPSMQGVYYYGDYCSGKIWGAVNTGGWQTSLLTTAPFSISSFGEGENAELYVADYGNGRIYQVTGN